MQPVQPKFYASRWDKINDDKIAPVDVYKILKEWKEQEVFNEDNISGLAREMSRRLSDHVAETNDEIEILYFDYDTTVGNSYTHIERLGTIYGNRIGSIEEMRNSAGILVQFRVIMKKVKE